METVTSDVIQERFDVGGHPELIISSAAGRISIRPGEDGVITMRATKSGSARAKEHTRVEYSHAGNRVNINTRSDSGGLLSITWGTCAVLYDLVVPADCEVRARSTSADVDIAGLRAPIAVQTTSGDVAVNDIGADCSITTVSGDVTGRKISGALTLRTTSGDAAIRQSSLRHFNLNTVSGDFSVETPLTASAQYLAKTVSGDLHVFLPPDTGATVQMKSVSGDVVSELPANVIKSGRRHWQGRIQGGGASLEMTSVSGDLRIGRSQGGIPEPGSSPTQDRATPPGAEDSAAAPLPPSDTTAVLQALERGEITVEEAMARLDALR